MFEAGKQVGIREEMNLMSILNREQMVGNGDSFRPETTNRQGR